MFWAVATTALFPFILAVLSCLPLVVHVSAESTALPVAALAGTDASPLTKVTGDDFPARFPAHMPLPTHVSHAE